MEKLDDYSQHFATVLFQAFPDWKQFSTAKKANENDECGFLVVEVPAPAKGLIINDIILKNGDFLWIYTDGEITVGFDYHHTHFDSYEGLSEVQEFDNAIEYIKSKIDEKICSVSIFCENSFCGSTSMSAGEKPNLSGWKWLDKSCRDVYVRSWEGTYNQKYNIDELRPEE